MTKPIYKRVLIKLSGGAMNGDNNILDFDKLSVASKVIKRIVDAGTQVAVVMGGGNIWRGRSSGKMDRVRADGMGMAATLINSLALQQTLEDIGQKSVIQSGLEVKPYAHLFEKADAIEALEGGKVVIFACGTGHPYFSTDTAGVLRAIEIEADIALFCKDIDGVYTADPRMDKTAKKLDEITYSEILSKGLKVIDAAAAAMAGDAALTTLLFAAEDPENIYRVIMGEKMGTIVH